MTVMHELLAVANNIRMLQGCQCIDFVQSCLPFLPVQARQSEFLHRKNFLIDHSMHQEGSAKVAHIDLSDFLVIIEWHNSKQYRLKGFRGKKTPMDNVQ
jgi:hypothetical protein